MILIYGTYRFGKKVVEEKEVYCKTCEEESLAKKESSFKMIHMFFLPLIPLGRDETWSCGKCGNDPSEPTRSKGIRVLLVLITLATVVWAFLAEPKDGDVESIWMVRILLFLILLGVLWWAARPFRIPEEAETPATTKDE